MQGAVGLDKIRAIQSSLREEPPARIGGLRVQRVIDWQDQERFGPFVSETDRSTRNVLSFLLEQHARVTIRPSGTEPKNKSYVEVRGEPMPDASPAEYAAEHERLLRLAREIADDFVLQSLARVGQTLPRAALRVSDLVPLEDRIRVVERVAPELAGRVDAMLQGETSREDLGLWLERTLRPCGNDPAGLVLPGIEAVFDEMELATDLRKAALDLLR
jgi:hypothetical protein